MKLNKPIKTIRDAYNAVRQIFPDECYVSSTKTVRHNLSSFGKSQETEYTVFMNWENPPDTKGFMTVMGMGKTPRKTFLDFIENLKKKLSERNSLTGIDLSDVDVLPVASLTGPISQPKRLTHSVR